MSSAAQMLVIVGGADVQKEVFSRHGFGLWSAAFGSILEKYGYLSFDTASEDVLGDPKLLSGYSVLFVGFLPAERWQGAYIQSLLAFKGVLVIEGECPDQFAVCGHEKIFLHSRGGLVTRPPLYSPACIISEDIIVEKAAQACMQLALAIAKKPEAEDMHAAKAFSILRGMPSLQPFHTSLPQFSDREVRFDVGSKAGLLSDIILTLALQSEENDAEFRKIIEHSFDSKKFAIKNGRVSSSGYKEGKNFINTPTALLALAIFIKDKEIRVKAFSPVCADDIVGAWLRPPLLQISEKMEILRNGNRITGSSPFLSYMVYAHTLPVMRDHYVDITVSDFLSGVDEFFKMVEKCSEELGIKIVRVAAWPCGFHSALTIRHDVDRPVAMGDFKRLITFEKERGLKSSWYWINGRHDNNQMSVIKEFGFENALHTVSAHNKEQEVNGLAYLAPIYGETWHGSGVEYWNSALSVTAAKLADLSYTEFLPAVWDYPAASYPTMNSNGGITEIAGIIGITFNATVDAGGVGMQIRRKSEVLVDGKDMQTWMQKGRYLNLLNHPDIRFDQLISTLEYLDASACWFSTAAEVADWWKKSHSRDCLRIEVKNDVDVCIISKLSIQGLCLKIGEEMYTIEDIKPNTPLFMKINNSAVDASFVERASVL